MGMTIREPEFVMTRGLLLDYERRAAKQERERIIKSLEIYAYDYLSTAKAIERDLSEDWHTGFTEAIIFIKGEQK